MGKIRKIRLVATDLDGTLLKNDKSISEKDRESLGHLAEMQVVRVIATGRNLKKVREVIPDETEFDYVIFSSGAGIYDCGRGDLLYARNIPDVTVGRLSRFLIKRGLGFCLFRKIPDNYRGWYRTERHPSDEFERYLAFNRSVLEEMASTGMVPSEACQFLLFFERAEEFFVLRNELESRFDDLKVVRASSPFLTGYTWMEIFHRDVSKGNAVRFLCSYLDIVREATMGIGNDYNDLDLLNYTSFSYVVENGPEELRRNYMPAPSNEANAFSYCVSGIFDRR